MTPLEELQAAHKRLSELKNRTSYGSWVNHLGEVVTSDHFLVATFGDTDEADLAITLHRTIDAQLAIIGTEIARCAEEQISWRSTFDDPIGQENRFYWSPTESSLALARAINGGIDD